MSGRLEPTNSPYAMAKLTAIETKDADVTITNTADFASQDYVNNNLYSSSADISNTISVI